MADLTPAPAGAKITAKARKVLVRAFGGARHAALVPERVSPKAANPTGRGSWVCITCGELPQNNLSAWGHAKPGHLFAWRNADTGDWETP